MPDIYCLDMDIYINQKVCFFNYYYIIVSKHKGLKCKKENSNICTWNIQARIQKQRDIISEIEQLTVNITVLTETEQN